jgi:hypothetical protein
VTGLINNIREIGQWHSVKMNFCKKKPKATKFSFVANIAKIVARILKRRIGRRLRIYVEKMSLDLEEQKDAESDITTNLGHRRGIVCLFHRLAEGICPSKWTRLIQIANETGSDWRDRKSSRNL